MPSKLWRVKAADALSLCRARSFVAANGGRDRARPTPAVTSGYWPLFSRFHAFTTRRHEAAHGSTAVGSLALGQSTALLNLGKERRGLRYNHFSFAPCPGCESTSATTSQATHASYKYNMSMSPANACLYGHTSKGNSLTDEADASERNVEHKQRVYCNPHAIPHYA